MSGERVTGKGEGWTAAARRGGRQDHRQRRAAWAGVATITIAAIWLALSGAGVAAVTVAVFAALATAFLIDGGVPPAIDAAFVVVAGIDAAGFVWNLFERFGPFDEIAHLLTTFTVTLAVGLRVYRRILTPVAAHPLLVVLVLASFGTTVGVGWEVFEWLTGGIGGLRDTITDLVLDGAGATLAGVVAARLYAGDGRGGNGG